MDAMPSLDHRHPYRLLGRKRVGEALDWFFRACDGLDQRFVPNGYNTMTLTAAGLEAPAYAPCEHQARSQRLTGGKVAVVSFQGHNDFPAELIGRGLEIRGFTVMHRSLDPPGGQTETVALARAFDRLPDPGVFFREVEKRLEPGTGLVLFPALLGLERHGSIMDRAAAMDLPCLEVPTLPPSVPGLRLAHALERRLARGHALLHQGCQATGQRGRNHRFIAASDQNGRCFEASAFILASGGVLMGGLEVDSHNRVREPAFGLEVFQTGPLDVERVDHALDALHRAGVETDDTLRPRRNGALAHDNVFVTGTTLAHWNPMEEASAEGVSIATGWAAAEAAHAYLEGR